MAGILRDAVDGWVSYVRPLIGDALGWITRQLNWQIELSDDLKDYVGVGFVQVAALFRGGALAFNNYTITRAQTVIVWFGLLLVALSSPLLWPIWMIITAGSGVLAFVVRWLMPKIPGLEELSLASMLSLVPLAYLGLLLLANACLQA